jgi:alcohol dehydrogenase class IV
VENLDFLNLRKFAAPEFIFGLGAADLAGQYAVNYEVDRVLVVTDPGVITAGWAQSVMDSLARAGASVVLFSGVSENPRDYEVMEGAAVYAAEGCGAIVAVGGGSPMDLAKGVGIVSANGGHILDYEGADKVPIPCPPLICLPTTAGTGAEVSQFAIITDTARRVKIAIVSKTTIPDVALIDPKLTTTMDAKLTAHTGLDALTHAVEAYVSNASSPITDMFALSAVRRAGRHLAKAMARPNDMIQRGGMCLASLEAGLAFSNAILGAVHAMAHSLGGYLDLPHGECNAILLPHVMAANYDFAPERFDAIAVALGVRPDGPGGLNGLDASGRKQALVGAVNDLKHSAGVTRGLSDLGVSRADIANLAAKAVLDPCMLTNPTTLSLEEVEEIYARAL